MKKHLKSFIVEKKYLKAVPNSLTLCNSLCGFFAIVNTAGFFHHAVNNHMTSEQVFSLSAFMILFAMIFDCLDGFAARILNACSMHGLQMDSLADMVTFGTAPAVLTTVMTYSMKTLTGRQTAFVWLLCAVYLGGAALRLATYNVHAMLEKKSSDKFSGLPSPGGAAAICTTVILCTHLNFKIADYWYILPIYGAVLGLLMVSPIPYLHVGKWLVTARRDWRKIAFVIIVLLFACWQTAWTGFILVNAYIILGFFAGLYALWKESRKVS